MAHLTEEEAARVQAIEGHIKALQDAEVFNHGRHLPYHDALAQAMQSPAHAVVVAEMQRALDEIATPPETVVEDLVSFDPAEYDDDAREDL